jgi:chromosomal replication initiation ATPase DnaA
MSAADMVRTYREVRTRLYRPPNAVSDSGIDLKKKRIPKPPEISPVFEPETKEVLENTVPPPRERKPIMVKTIERAVCSAFNLKPQELWGESRKPALTYPRHIAWYLACEHTNLSTPGVARHTTLVGCNCRDHTSIMHGRDKIKDLLTRDGYTKVVIRLLEFMLFTGEYDD